jgi:hypothetical protein
MAETDFGTDSVAPQTLCAWAQILLQAEPRGQHLADFSANATPGDGNSSTLFRGIGADRVRRVKGVYRIRR